MKLNLKITLFFFLLLVFFLPSFSRPLFSQEQFYTFDLSTDKYNSRSEDGFDHLLLVSALQGLVNRQGPRLYIYRVAMLWANPEPEYQARGYPDADHYWLNQFTKNGGWLENYQKIPLSSINSLLDAFSEINQVVIWDPRVGATANIATTIAGVNNALPVMHGGSLYQELVNQRNYHVVVDLYQKNFTDTSRIPESNTPTTGSAKVNAYLWAKEKYLDTGLSNSGMLAYLAHFPYQDFGDQLTARDIVVREKGFVFDLSPWNDEPPLDDPNQGKCGPKNEQCDLWILKQIFSQANQNIKPGQVVEIIGYPPWWEKYSDYKDSNSNHTPVDLEDEFTRIASSYAVGMLPSDHGGANNTSFHYNAPQNSKLWQNRPANRLGLENKTYILYIKGDYDGIGQHGLPYSWDDQNRSSDFPLAWGITPAFFKYAPDIVTYLYQTKNPADYFIAHDSGCLYIRPDYWPANRFQDYKNHCLSFYSRLDYTITGFILGGDQLSADEKQKSAYLDAFYYLSGDGISISSDSRSFGNDFLYQPSIYGQKTPVVAGLGTVGLAWNLDELDNAINHLIFKLEGRSGYGDPYLGSPSNFGKEPRFLVVRKGPATKPSFLETLHQGLQQRFSQKGWGELKVTNPYDFFNLRRLALGDTGNTKHRASYHLTGLPKTIHPGDTLNLNLEVRNNGQNTWLNHADSNNDGKPHRLTKSLVVTGQEHTWDTYNRGGRIELPRNVAPGQTTTVSFNLTAPTQPGKYSLQIDMMRELVTGFREQGNPPFEVEITVDKKQSVCSSCSSGPPKSSGNSNCDDKINITDFSIWLQVYRKILGNQSPSQEELSSVDFNCQPSDSSSTVNLQDFQIWLQSYKERI